MTSTYWKPLVTNIYLHGINGRPGQFSLLKVFTWASARQVWIIFLTNHLVTLRLLTKNSYIILVKSKPVKLPSEAKQAFFHCRSILFQPCLALLILQVNQLFTSTHNMIRQNRLDSRSIKRSKIININLFSRLQQWILPSQIPTPSRRKHCNTIEHQQY